MQKWCNTQIFLNTYTFPVSTSSPSSTPSLAKKAGKALIAWITAVTLSTSAQAESLIQQCDWIDRAWVIHQDKKNEY